jgi:hypothetical protein
MQLTFLTTDNTSCDITADYQFVYPYHTLKSLSYQPGKFDEYEKFLFLFFVMS